ncbi:MAG: hypothetical protein KDM63_05035 [Verrucomicrobiae bacterium]|nr:hypothetical protein [Verrucomicrobiae bacterium]MCB1086387.1 hypothetical protein [Verrucomicrobiae bacterium]
MKTSILTTLLAVAGIAIHPAKAQEVASGQTQPSEPALQKSRFPITINGQAIAIGLETKADELLDFVKKVNPQVRSRSTERIHMYDFPTGEGNAIDEVHFMFTQSDSKLARVTIIGITKPFQQSVADLSHWLVVKGAQKVQDPNKGEVIKHEGWTFSFWEGKSAYDQNVTEHGMDIIFDGRKADLGLDG